VDRHPETLQLNVDHFRIAMDTNEAIDAAKKETLAVSDGRRKRNNGHEEEDDSLLKPLDIGPPLR
jgi:hypothetical protein